MTERVLIRVTCAEISALLDDAEYFKIIRLMLDALISDMDVSMVKVILTDTCTRLDLNKDKITHAAALVDRVQVDFLDKLPDVNCRKWAFVESILPPKTLSIRTPVGQNKDIARFKLECYYRELGLSTAHCAMLLEVTQAYVWRLIKDAGIIRRPPSNCLGSTNGSWKTTPIKDYDTFYHHYVTLDKGLGTIAKEFGVSKRLVARWRKIHGIPAHSMSTWHKNNARIGENSPMWKDLKCLDCGARKKNSNIKRCWDCHVKHRVGKHNGNYRGGPSSVMIGVRGWSNRVWRQAVFERDMYTCQKCGDSRGGNLNAHHVKRLRVLVDEGMAQMPGDITDIEDKVNWLINHPPITDISNGVTLCESCHQQIHKGRVRDVVPV